MTTIENLPVEVAKSSALKVRVAEGESEQIAHARLLASPVAGSSVTVLQYHPLAGASDGCDINALQDEMRSQVAAVQAGDLSQVEAMLTAQAHSLDTIFNTLAQKAATSMRNGHAAPTEIFFRMALKAQSQCRTTVEAIAEIKFPKSVTFIRQANVANQQQVNNGVQSSAANALPMMQAHEKNILPSNELLMEAAHASLDK